jgi:glycosyltransferase involved in cell wall biosynthesis
MATITGAVLTMNEEQNIEFCLRSLYTWCDEVIVVDMRSTDRTREIAHRYTDKVLDHEPIRDFGLARQLGLDNSTSDWFLSVDADEVVTPELADWIRAFVDSDPPYEAALIPRANVFLGRWLRSTPWWPGKPRLFRRDWLTVTAELHHSLIAKEGARVARLPRRPEISLWHFTRLSLEDIASKTNKYTTIEALTALSEGRGDPSMRALFWRSMRELVVYGAKRGYRDGLGGLAYALDRAYYRFLLQAKRWDIPRAAKRRARYDRWREKILSGFPDAGRAGGAAQRSEQTPVSSAVATSSNAESA